MNTDERRLNESVSMGKVRITTPKAAAGGRALAAGGSECYGKSMRVVTAN